MRLKTKRNANQIPRHPFSLVPASITAQTGFTLLIWSLLILALVYLTHSTLNQYTHTVARAEARSHFNKDQAIRYWAASHGGIYVPTNDRTPPNPYLSHLPQRDIQKPDGIPLTLMNPAYMIRQMNEEFAKFYGVAGHITSLKPLRPENAPDSWERLALQSFEQGEKEALEFTEIDGAPYLRLMQPMITKKGCLKCHAHQGYVEGDVRGGVAVALPMQSLYEQEQVAFRSKASQLFVLWLAGVLFILFQGRLFHRNEQKLQNSVDRLQTEYDKFLQGPVITFTWQNQEHWPVEQVSANIHEILGYQDQELLSGTVRYTELIHPDDLERVFAEVASGSALDNKTFAHAPYRLQTKEGNYIWVLDHTTILRNPTGVITHYAGYIIDITQAMMMEEKLRQSKERLELTIDGANLGTWDWNIPTGDVVFNERWAEILGYQLNEVEPTVATWEKIIHPDESEEIMRVLTDHLEGRSPLYMTEHRLKHKSGKWVWVLDVGKVFQRDESGAPLRAVGIHLDITEQKEGEETLRTAMESAEAANHAKSVFLSNMSHELRTPLNAILGYTQLFTSDSTLTDKQQSGVRTIHKAGEHLLMLINDILDLSKIEACKLELVPGEIVLESFLRSLNEIIQVRSRAKSLEYRFEPGVQLPVTIVADELRLRQVLLNLLSNAIKFTESGYCSLQVKSEPVDQEKIHLTFVVEDSGPGIPEAMQEKVFDPFQQSGERLKYAEGSGLGLSISRQLVSLMEGELTLISPAHEEGFQDGGPGCRFVFSAVFPASSEMAQNFTEPQATNYSISDMEPGSKTILVVDDQPSNRAVLRDTLEPLGFVVGEAEDGSRVLAACERLQPDIILMDLHMPVVDGFGAAKQLRSDAAFSQVPVIAITASTMDAEKLKKRCHEYGFNGYLTKPFLASELFQTLAGLLGLELQESQEAIEADEEPIIAPPQRELEQLQSYLQDGDIDAIAVMATELVTMDSGRYKTFANRLNELVADVQLDGIEHLLEKFLTK